MKEDEEQGGSAQAVEWTDMQRPTGIIEILLMERLGIDVRDGTRQLIGHFFTIEEYV